MNKDFEKYLKMENGTQYKSLRIHLSYDLGGMNYWNSQVDKRGYYLFVSPCHHGNNGMIETALGAEMETSGFKVFLEETKRRNNAVMKALWSNVLFRSQRIRDLFQEKKYHEINDMLIAL